MDERKPNWDSLHNCLVEIYPPLAILPGGNCELQCMLTLADIWRDKERCCRKEVEQRRGVLNGRPAEEGVSVGVNGDAEEGRRECDAVESLRLEEVSGRK